MELVLWECPFKMSVALMLNYHEYTEYLLEVARRLIYAERNSTCDSSFAEGIVLSRMSIGEVFVILTRNRKNEHVGICSDSL